MSPSQLGLPGLGGILDHAKKLHDPRALGLCFPGLRPDRFKFHYSNRVAEYESVSSGFNASFEDVLGALQGSGIALSNFTGVFTSQGPFTADPATGLPVPSAPGLTWSFVTSASLSKIKETLATLTAVQQNVAKKNNGLSVSFGVQGAQVSPQSQQSQVCVLSDLVADARAQAQKLADAANVGVGVILAMSGATSGGTLASAGITSVLIPFVPGCSLTVKFALQRF